MENNDKNKNSGLKIKEGTIRVYQTGVRRTKTGDCPVLRVGKKPGLLESLFGGGGKK